MTNDSKPKDDEINSLELLNKSIKDIENTLNNRPQDLSDSLKETWKKLLNARWELMIVESM